MKQPTATERPPQNRGEGSSSASNAKADETTPCDDETTPLIQKKPGRSLRDVRRGVTGLASHAANWAAETVGELAETEVHIEEGGKAVTYYNVRHLGDLKSMMCMTGTVFTERRLWYALVAFSVISTCIALGIFLLVPDPRSVNTSAVSHITSMLEVFVAFLLGMYLNFNLGRWQMCVQGFDNLYSCVQDLQVQLISLGVEEEAISRCTRYGLASGVILKGERERKHMKPKDHEKSCDEMWKQMEALHLLTLAEIDKLTDNADSPGIMWVWVASYLGHLSTEEKLPNHGSTAFTSLVATVKKGQESIGTIQNALDIPAPYVYAHMLSFMVGLNNILCAISFGLTFGIEFGSFLNECGIKIHNVRGLSDEHAPHVVESQNAIFRIGLAFATYTFVPLLYQAAFLISLAMASPFNPSLTTVQIPVQTLCKSLMDDLELTNKLAKQLPGFPAPLLRAYTRTVET